MKEERTMGIVIRIEEFAITTVATYFITIHNLGLPVWAWVILFFSPDLSMLGYLANTRLGAYTYNLFHHRGIALAAAATGFLMHLELLTAAGLLLMAHSSFDRMMGYGLKYTDSFRHTSLGLIGKKE